MEAMERADKLRICQHLLESEDWEFLSGEVSKLVNGKSMEIDSLQARGAWEVAQYHAGYKRALEDILRLPQKIYKENQTVMERMKSMLGGIK